MEFLFPKEEGTTRVALPPRGEQSSHRAGFAVSCDVIFVTKPPKKRQKTTSPLATVWLQRERAVPEGDRLTKTPTHHDPVFMLRECQCAQSLLRAGRAGMMSPPSGVV